MNQSFTVHDSVMPLNKPAANRKREAFTVSTPPWLREEDNVTKFGWKFCFFADRYVRGRFCTEEPDNTWAFLPHTAHWA
jgi:hypothetical protein